jgi:threonine/homoserine/homoserine lactone efflux protein
MEDTDTEQADPGALDKAWAVLGLVAAAVLGYMAVDLLRAKRAPAADAEGSQDDKPCDC